MKCLSISPSAPRHRSVLRFVVVAAAVFGSFAGAVHGQTISTSRFAYGPGEDILVSFFGGPGNPNDWIAVYLDDDQPGEDDPNHWQSVGGRTEGTITIPGILSRPGDYFIYFLLDGTDEWVARQYFELNWSSDPDAFICTQHSDYWPHTPISVTWTGGSGSPLDRIEIHTDRSLPGEVEPLLWKYVGGGQNPGEGLMGGTVTFEDGLPEEDDYTVFLVQGDGQTIQAGRLFSVINSSEALLRTDKRVYAPGDAISVGFLGGFANPKDWIGIYPVGEDPGVAEPLFRQFTDGTQSGGIGLAEGSVTFPAGLGAIGSYDVYFHFVLDEFNTFWAAKERIFVRETSRTPPLPKLDIAREGNEVTLTWDPTGGFELERTADLANPAWVPAGDSASNGAGSWKLEIDPEVDTQFFRLRPVE